jgi:hypothetical protein
MSETAARELVERPLKGLSKALSHFSTVSVPIAWSLVRQYLRHRTFSFRDRVYRYFWHSYNRTWMNERSVEVPIIWQIVKQHRGRRVLEVGNVLSHYFPVCHEILDKYESGHGIINEDVVNFCPADRYDLIVSISTLEHVGWDETPRDPEKALRAVENLRGLLAPGGRLVVTIPLGYNPEMDQFLRAGRIPLSERYCLRRPASGKRWEEASWEDTQQAQYDQNCANGLVIGVIESCTASIGGPGAPGAMSAAHLA